MGLIFIKPNLSNLLSNRGQFFFNPGAFTLTAPHIIQLGPANLAGLNKFDFIDAWAENREDTFNTHTIRNFANGETLAVSTFSAMVKHYTLKLLDTFLITFADFYMDVDRVPSLETRNGSPFGCQFLFYYLH